MPFAKFAIINQDGHNIPRDVDVTTQIAKCGTWKKTLLEIVVLSIFYMLAAAFAALPTVYTLWRHF